MFVLQLFFVGQHLPLATTAGSEMTAERFGPIGRIAPVLKRKSFCPVFFVFGEAQVDHIARYGMFDEDHLAIDPGQALAFGGIAFHQHVL